MLDDECDDIDGTAQYKLGCIGRHNVVIVCLPAGQIGRSSATVVVGELRHKFPAVQIRLMVGIRGGVPKSDVDIRLGDVVISQPQGPYGGVVQYDLGKTGFGGSCRSNLLNYLLLVPNHILFDPSYSHVKGATCDQCDKNMVIRRTQQESEEPFIHCGTIASSNQVIKYGLWRDKLSSELGGILYFEIEAAGLMNALPSLIIQGICDYADSYKNKKWQPFAAAVAAACAKKILSFVPAAWRSTCPAINLTRDTTNDHMDTS
ncbi:purine and uridine phosphorylase [Zopfia rhizophila CBS 207.26]|uniref:Purine and uridine phosphorylase n=1 Tax=Zopfia rhizophila CBS 207.26 TaxID=1314779 RepID=A0A6A6DBZ2_9PEZI|nr:purine and uridine phosphorylase [Zopfia rhizophila CBS 207.26]